MTPLAHTVARWLCLPPNKMPVGVRWHAAQLRELLTGAHFFEITDAVPLLCDLVDTLSARSADDADEAIGRAAFLPAPKVWFERAMGPAARHATIAIEIDDDLAEAWEVIWVKHDGDVVVNFVGHISLNSGDIYVNHRGDGRYADGSNVQISLPTGLADFLNERGRSSTDYLMGVMSIAQLACVVINTPKMVKRDAHPPHAGLAKQLRGSASMRDFSPQGWVEIKLHVAKPVEIDDGEPHEPFVSGKRALHFVRKFMRIRCGKLEYVTSHWRGDAAVGIKQSHYSVAA